MEFEQQKKILDVVADYYSDKILTHGITPKGVDWNDTLSQEIRFRELCRILPLDSADATILDLGCGYGALVDYLDKHNSFAHYVGIDISAEMLASARGAHSDRQDVTFTLGSDSGTTADFGMASGIFNVKLGQSDSAWKAYILRTLGELNDACQCGFSVNFLTSYSDPERQREDLYYANPLEMFDYCKKNFSREVSLLHDYRLWEFTILVRK